MSTLDELGSRAGKWLGLSPAPERHTAAVVADRFDQITWRDTYDQSAGLRELAEELDGPYDDTTDLLADVFLAAYKVGPRVRERADMDPSRLVNHQVIASLMESPEFAELHRETAGDPYAAAMAVLAQAAALRRMLERSREVRTQGERAQKAQRDAEEPGEDGTVPAPAADAVQRAIEAAEDAEAAARRAAQDAAQALTAAAPGIRTAVRNAAAKAAGAVREEAALMRAWGVGPGELERMPFDQRARLAERLRTGRLAQWAELIGRFRQMAGGCAPARWRTPPGNWSASRSATTSPASSRPSWRASACPSCALCSPRATPPGS
jgi:hypothetical protein